MGTNFAIRSIPTHELAAELVQHCKTEAPIIAEQNRAVAAATGRSTAAVPTLAECRAVYEAEVQAIDKKFFTEGKALLKLQNQIDRQRQKATSWSSGPARLWAIEKLESTLEQRATGLLDSMFQTRGADYGQALESARQHEAKLIHEKGGINSVMLTSRVSLPGLDIQDPAARAKYYSDRVFVNHSLINQNFRGVVEVERDRLDTALKAFNQNPNPQTRSALIEAEAKLNRTLDDRSHTWMQMKWLADLRDESARHTFWGWATPLLEKVIPVVK